MELKEKFFNQYKVWDIPTRIFHWINFSTVILLIFMGLMMLYKKEIGITSLEAKITLKTIHVLIGYVFTLNLLMRLGWGFVGNRFARWSNILPGKGFGATISSYYSSLKSGKPQQFLGHNPLGRIAVTVIIFALLVMSITGLIRAGTDIYYPPFGSTVADYIAKEGVDPASLIPYDKSYVNQQKMKALKVFKDPIGKVHVFTAYFLIFLIFVHILAVVRAEIKESQGLISAMFSGNKTLTNEPEDK